MADSRVARGGCPSGSDGWGSMIVVVELDVLVFAFA